MGINCTTILGAIFASLTVIGFLIIGIILKRMNSVDKPEKKKPFKILLDIIIFIIKTETLSFAGKVNIVGAILAIIAGLVLELPLIFSFFYKLIFGTQLIDTNSFTCIIYGIIGCIIPISIIEAIFAGIEKIIKAKYTN